MDRIFFEIHGSKLKPDPFAYLGQASEIGVSHAVFFFGVGEDTFNCFFSMLIQLAIFRCMPYIFGKLNVIRPDVLGNELFMLGIVGAAA